MTTANIEIRHANGRFETRTLGAGSYTIGRDCGDIVLSDPDVSAQHARLDIGPGSATLTDLGSTNGTFDAGGARAAAPITLRPGQAVRLGGSYLSLAIPAAGGTRQMPQAQEPARAAGASPPPAVAVERRPSTDGFRAPRGQYKLHWMTGTVLESSTMATTHVTSSGGYGDTPLHVSSSTTVTNTLFLRTPRGTEKSLQLNHFNLATRPGHELIVVWAIKEGDEEGPYVAVHNYTTGKTFLSRVALDKVFTPSPKWFWISILLLVPTFGLSIVMMIAAIVGARLTINRGIEQFTRNLKF